jgi:hypothetical protein
MRLKRQRADEPPPAPAVGGEYDARWDPLVEFHSVAYLRHNQRRQEHLASLGLPLANRSVIEVGAGIGDHTSFFLDRNCEVVTSDGRPENLRLLQQRLPHVDARLLDLDQPEELLHERAEIVYCYGTLYHLRRPSEALAFLADRTSDLLLLETCVSVASGEHVNPVPEELRNPSQALTGHGCRPTRAWVRARLEEHFPFVYMTTTQPWHEEFPLTWSFDSPPEYLTRAVFVASRRALESPQLTTSIPKTQTRH